MASDAALLYAEIPGNVCFDYEYGNEAAVNEAFSRAAHVTRLSLDSTRVVGNPMEPKAALAAYDAASETYDLYSPTQGISLILGGLSAITGAPREKIRVVPNAVEAPFMPEGPRAEGDYVNAIYEYHKAVALLEFAVGRPLR